MLCKPSHTLFSLTLPIYLVKIKVIINKRISITILILVIIVEAPHIESCQIVLYLYNNDIIIRLIVIYIKTLEELAKGIAIAEKNSIIF